MTADPTQIGRNEPCPCGSGKKYKRCCGVSAAPKLTPPKQAPGPMGGFDPSSLGEAEQQSMLQFSQMLARLPKGQMQRLQSIMQRAMAGKDVTREAEEFEKTLPVELQEMVRGLQMPGAAGQAAAALPDITASDPGLLENKMTEEEARALVAKAAAEGKISGQQAESLLGEAAPEATKRGIGKFFQGFSGKKPG